MEQPPHTTEPHFRQLCWEGREGEGRGGEGRGRGGEGRRGREGDNMC